MSIGYRNNRLVSQSSINQGVGAARFAITDPNSASSSSVHLRLEEIEGTNNTDEFGINFHYVDSSLGNLNAYTYKEKSIIESLRVLEEFGDNTAYQNNLLYEYVNDIMTILKIITGTSSLSSSLDEAKEEVSFNINSLLGLIGFDSSYDEAGNSFTNDPTNYYPIENTIRLKVDLSKISDNFASPFTIVIDFSDENLEKGSIFSVGIENLKINDCYGTFKLYVKSGDTDINNLKIQDLSINEKGSATPFVDLTDLPILVKMAIKTCDTRKYYISGTFKLNISTFGGWITSLEGRNLDIHIYLRVSDEKNENNVHYVDALLYFKGSEGETVEDDKTSDYDFYEEKTNSFETLIYISGTDVYIKQIRNIKVQKYKKKSILGIPYKSKDGSAYNAVDIDYFKSTSEDLINNLMFYLFVIIFNSHTNYSEVQKYSDLFSGIDSEPLNMLEKVTHEGDSWIIKAGYNSLFSATVNLNHDNEYKLSSISVSAKVIMNIFNLELNASNNDFNDVSNQINYDNAMGNFNNFINAFNSDSKTANLEYRTGEEETSTNIYKAKRVSEGTTSMLSYNGKNY